MKTMQVACSRCVVAALLICCAMIPSCIISRSSEVTEPRDVAMPMSLLPEHAGMQTRRENGYRFAAEPVLRREASAAAPQQSAADWLAQSKATYAGLTRYSEDGLLEDAMREADDISLGRWQMRFDRGGGFAFRWEQRGFLGYAPKNERYMEMLDNYQDVYRIWRKPGESQAFTRWSVRKNNLETMDAAKAAGGGFGVTRMTSGWAMAMLSPQEFQLRTHPLDLSEPVIDGYATVDGAECVVIRGTCTEPRTECTRVFIDMGTTLARRWERTQSMRFQGDKEDTHMREVWHVRPIANGTFAADAFAEPEFALAPWMP